MTATVTLPGNHRAVRQALASSQEFMRKTQGQLWERVEDRQRLMDAPSNVHAKLAWGFPYMDTQRRWAQLLEDALRHPSRIDMHEWFEKIDRRPITVLRATVSNTDDTYFHVRESDRDRYRLEDQYIVFCATRLAFHLLTVVYANDTTLVCVKAVGHNHAQVVIYTTEATNIRVE